MVDMACSKVVYEGWMVRHGRRKIGKSFIHMRYFVLEPRLLAYYKKKPQENVVMVPSKTLVIDGNCRVEDRGMQTHQGHMVYVLSVYNVKEKFHKMTMGAFNIQEALTWKEKIDSVIDQHQESRAIYGKKYQSFEYKSGKNDARNASSSDHESQRNPAEVEEDSYPNSLLRMPEGHGTPECVLNWTNESDLNWLNQNTTNHAFPRKYRLLQCQNGLRIFEELLEPDLVPKSCSRAMKAVGVVEATCEETFELVMSMDTKRYEWDCSFLDGSLVEEVDGHTAILYHRLQLDWFPMLVWPRDLCYVRYWRRNDDGSYVVVFRSREHPDCGPQPGFVRAHIESGGFTISPLKSHNGVHRTQVQHLMQIDLKGWGVGHISWFQHHCVFRMLNSVAGLREYLSQTDVRSATTRIPVMVNMASGSRSTKSILRTQSSSLHRRNVSIDTSTDKNNVLADEFSDEDEDFQGAADQEVPLSSSTEAEDKKNVSLEETQDALDVSAFAGNIRRDDDEKARNCWTLSDGNNFRVRSKNYCHDRSKTPAGKHLMDLVAVDWFKDTKRMDHVARISGCAAKVASDRGNFCVVVNMQVPGTTHYSMVFYFVTKKLIPGSLLHRFVNGDDEFRNSRLKIIPSVPKGSWIVRQSVGSSPCLLGKAVDCNYIRSSDYLEIDVDIGSSTVAKGVLGLVVGVITSLVVDLAFLVQGNTPEELPEQLIGAVRVNHLELSSATEPPMLDP